MRFTHISPLAWVALVACTASPVAPPAASLDAEPSDPVDSGVVAAAPDASEQTARTGEQIYAAECALCHAANGAGGTGPSLIERVPQLSDVRIGEVVIAGVGTMPAKNLSGRELVSLIKYLRDTFGMQTMTPTVTPPRDGAAIYAAECAQCHGATGGGTMRGPPLGPRLPLLMDDAVRRIITAGTGNMPARNVAEPELTTLVTYLRATFGPYMPPVAGMEGRMIYSAQCERCHGADGMGGMRGPSLLERTPHLSQAMLGRTVTEGSGFMRGRSVAPADLPILVTFLHDTMGRYAHGAPDVSFDPAGGDQAYAALCASCHGADGRGGSGPAIDARVPALSNALLVNAITSGAAHTMPAGEPRLSPLVAYLRVTYGAYAPPMMPPMNRDGGVAIDSGAPGDAGVAAADAQPMGADAQPMGADAQPVGLDAQPVGLDAMGADAGAVRPDAAAPDAGATNTDAGAASTDAGTPPVTPRPQTTCGNGAADRLEVCDGMSWASWADGPACADFGLGAGNASCTAQCYVDLSSCTGGTDACLALGWYNDGWCDACDRMGGTVDPDCALHCGAEGTCADYFDAAVGVWTCRAQGATDPDCGACGNGFVEGSEYCDGANLDNADCTDYGYRGGTLACASDCLPDLSACTNTLCTNTCIYAGDGECDDGGPASDYSLCALGTDCMDCGPR